MAYITTLFLSLFITLAAIPIFKGIAVRAKILDIPDGRKVHSAPIPKSGGLGMALGFCIPVVLWLPLDAFTISVLIGTAILVVAGVIDDRYVLGYKAKFAAQVAAALVVIFLGEVKISSLGMLLPDEFMLPGAVSMPLTIFVIVGVTNAINLADGLDGLAGGITLITVLCLCILSFSSGDTAAVMMSLALLGALFGFLTFNTYPASIFMGDAGSQFLGFLSIILSLKITQGNFALSPVLPLFIIGFPIIDTVLVMSERIRSKRSPFVADNNHIHHKLLGQGFFHTEAVFIIYLLQSLFVLSAYIFRFYSDWFVLSLYLFLSCAIIMYFHMKITSGMKIRRYELIDKVIKGRLRFLKNEEGMLRLATLILYYLLPCLLILNCLLIGPLPEYVSAVSVATATLIIVLWVRGNSMMGSMVRTVLYFMIPAIIYLGQENAMVFSDVDFTPAYLAACAACLLSAIIMMRYNRRENSFRSSPMDFLIIIIALCVSPLLSSIMDMQRTRLFLVQILIFFYSYEIVLNEQRRGRAVVTTTMVGALLIIALKGVLS